MENNEIIPENKKLSKKELIEAKKKQIKESNNIILK